MNFYRSILFTVIVLLSQGALFAQNHRNQPKHEFRGAWIATVANIDWPKARGGDVEKQKHDLCTLLDTLKSYNMNAVIFQVRPTSDAFYHSKYEPWSKYLTGTQGEMPESYFDPLAFVIHQCHRRGMELHAWFNPYRVKQREEDQLSDGNIAKVHPEWTFKYGKRTYFDPGLPQVRNWVADVVTDVVRRYDVDAIHFDDYFYPYPIAGKALPDSTSFARYPAGFEANQVKDWRRHNVNTIIKQLSDSIHATKPWVKFGISPFGVWREKRSDLRGSNTTGGMTNYDHLYADVIMWQEKKWIDYLLPQIYWYRGQPKVDYETLAHWWGENNKGRHCYIGNALYKMKPDASAVSWQSAQEGIEQIKLDRDIEGVDGFAFYSSKYLTQSMMGFKDSLKANYLSTPAFTPNMAWMDSVPPAYPININMRKVKRGRQIYWDPVLGGEMDKGRFYAVYRFTKADKLFELTPDNMVQFTSDCTFDIHRKFLRLFRKKHYYIITTVDRASNESMPSEIFYIKQ
ncbi:family 10 glycosylhydrolase [Halosquirtibacter xylanolyticus]|uniref:glycoside hydrolase family 10 protein n=1 Tax=Halosquirtibacter xylanolyticus TaxID=3374599 RepID=UPI003749BBAC|nr:family 10 glycosylhydrolase [Prolixibacteraceae bacterium]